MKAWLCALLTLAACFTGVSRAAELPDYIRYQQDKRGARLEVAIRTFTLPSGQSIDLVGAVHIADAAYYHRLNERFEAYDAVLFELVGDPSALTRDAPEVQAQQPAGSGVSFIQQAASRHLDLAFQLGSIDYTKKNMVHADASREEFARMEQERGENVLTLFVSAMQAQMNPANRAAMRELDNFALIRILMSPDSALEFKKALARSFDHMEAMTASMEGPKGSAILSGRNEIVIGKIRQVLASRKQRRIAVFYGAAHMPGIEASLIGKLGAEPAGEEWLTAWNMPGPARATTPPSDTTPALGTAKPAS
jgi:hypothetical protein